MASLYLLVRCAQAADAPPCQRVGESVTCTSTGFKVLTDKLIDAQLQATQCRLALADATSRAADCHADCEAIVPPVDSRPPEPPPRSPMPAVTGASLVAVSAAAVVLATVLSSWSPQARAGLALGGVSGLGIGMLIVLP